MLVIVLVCVIVSAFTAYCTVGLMLKRQKSSRLTAGDMVRIYGKHNRQG